MSFLNILLLGGAVAFAAPLLIHLLNRSKFQTVDWGAMHLLEAALQSNSRRVQWKSILLLLVRCLIPILLAVCLARPVLTRFQLAGADGQQTIAVLLDDSISMAAPGRDGTNRFEQARQEIDQLLQPLRGAEKVLLTTGSAKSPMPGMTFDNARFLSTLASQSPTAGSNRLQQAISEALSSLQTTSNPSRQLLIASDFVASDWAELTPPQRDALRQLANQGQFPIQITLLDVSPTNQTIENLSVAFEDPLDFNVLPDEIKSLRVVVTNHGVVAREDIQIDFELQGRVIATQTLTLDPAESRLLACRFALTETGWYPMQATIQDETGLAADNVATQVLRVNEAKRVLIVTSERKDDVEQPADFLKLALAPYADDLARQNRFVVDVVEERDFRPSQLGPQVDALILSGVPKLSDRNAQAIIDFVRAGGGLIVFGSETLDADWYRQRFVEQDRLLPRVFGPWQSQPAGQGLARARLSMPELQVFNGEDAGDLYELNFRSWSKLEAPSSPPPDSASESIGLSLQDGSPWLVAQRFGQGTVLQCATSCGSETTNLPLKPVYVPLVQQLAAAVTAATASPNVYAGEPIRLRVIGQQPLDAFTLQAVFRRQSEDVPEANVGEREFRFPDPKTSQVVALTLAPTGVVDFSPAGSASDNAALSLVIEPPLASVLPQVAESTTELLSDAQVAQLAEELGGTAVTSAAEYANQLELRKHGREIWRWLLLVLLVLLFAEILLARSISQGVA